MSAESLLRDVLTEKKEEDWGWVATGHDSTGRRMMLLGVVHRVAVSPLRCSVDGFEERWHYVVWRMSFFLSPSLTDSATEDLIRFAFFPLMFADCKTPPSTASHNLRTSSHLTLFSRHTKFAPCNSSSTLFPSISKSVSASTGVRFAQCTDLLRSANPSHSLFLSPLPSYRLPSFSSLALPCFFQLANSDRPHSASVEDLNAQQQIFVHPQRKRIHPQCLPSATAFCSEDVRLQEKHLLRIMTAGRWHLHIFEDSRKYPSAKLEKQLPRHRRTSETTILGTAAKSSSTSPSTAAATRKYATIASIPNTKPSRSRRVVVGQLPVRATANISATSPSITSWLPRDNSPPVTTLAVVERKEDDSNAAQSPLSFSMEESAQSFGTVEWNTHEALLYAVVALLETSMTLARVVRIQERWEHFVFAIRLAFSFF